MCAHQSESGKPNLLVSILGNRCPRCRRGKLFLNSNPYALKTTTHMPVHCPVCGQAYELQTGFYFGTGYVSYGISVGLTFAVFLAWYLLAGLSIYDNSIFWCLGTAIAILILLQPVIQRLSRSIWIACFVPYDPEWNKIKTADH